MRLRRKYFPIGSVLGFVFLRFVQSQFANSNRLNKLACKIESTCTLGYTFTSRLAHIFVFVLVFIPIFALATI